MYHLRFKGSHYEAGFQWGSRMKKLGFSLLAHTPFPLNEERRDFTAQCMKSYQTWFPEVVEEIKGLADGQGAAFEDFATVLFSMYAIVPDQKCTCFIIRDQEKAFLCRNSDFFIALEKTCMNVRYHLDEGYAFQGNTTAFIEMEDGMNEHGLAVGFTAIAPTTKKPGINAGFLVRYLLEKCATVKEAIACLHELPIASAQTLAICDASGDGVIVECNCEHVEVIHDAKKMASVNVFQSKAMRHVRRTGIDDWQADERYQTVIQALADMKEVSLRSGMDILAGKHGFLCQYDRKTGKDTIWSVVYDCMQGRLYRCEGNPSRRSFKEDTRVFSSSKTRKRLQ